MTLNNTLLAVVDKYLEALYQGDVNLFLQVFHPSARLFSATDGSLVELDVSRYMTIVQSRPSPASRSDIRRDEVLCVEQSSPTTAHARLRNSYAPKRFVDELTFIHLDGEWRIVAKIWHYEIELA